MQLDELLRDGEPQTEPTFAEAEISRRVTAGIELGEKRLKQVLKRLRFQPHTPIFNPDPGSVLFLVQVGGELDLAIVGRELDGVGQQVDKHGADLVGIDLERAQVRRDVKPKMKVSGHHERTNLIDHPLQQSVEINRSPLEGAAEIISA